MNQGMLRTSLIVVVAGLFGLPAFGAPIPGDATPPEVAQAALDYAKAVVAGDADTAWELLSERSRAEVTEVTWERAVQSRPVTR
ncbi:MAG: hypothetical protein JXA57_14860, partial [Armatimonadetes bacterium]|nr:hypothetical protein [Armatimonadota bacterium]